MDLGTFNHKVEPLQKKIILHEYIHYHPSLKQLKSSYIVQDEQLNLPSFQKEVSSNIFVDERFNDVKDKMLEVVIDYPIQMEFNLYCLGFDGSKKLTQLNVRMKENIKTHLSQYRLVTDRLTLKIHL